MVLAEHGQSAPRRHRWWLVSISTQWALLLALALSATLFAAPVLAEGEQRRELVVLSWGGAYERAQQRALFEPFTEATGIAVRVEEYDGGIEELREAVAQGNAPWDLLDMTRSSARAACAEGLLEPLSTSILSPAPDGTSVGRDFLEGSLGRCWFTHSIFATVVAYRRDAFPGRRPTRIADLFDQQRFPGPRALQRTPAANMEWALLSYGVPRQELYRLLSTRRGLALALARIDDIDPLHWWVEGEEPVSMLAANQVVMASGYNGRFFTAMVEQNLPIEILWDGQIQEHEVWAIPRHAESAEVARQFIGFATTTDRQTALANLIPYGPSRHSAILQVSTHPDHGVDMRLHIPTHPLNAERAVRLDDDWYASTYRRVGDYFRAALLEKEGSSVPPQRGGE